MTRDRDMLARIERDEQWLTGLLETSVPAPPETIARTRQAVAVELERAWLGRLGDPAPEAATLERVQAAVREELDRSGWRAVSVGNRRIFAAVSAAACFLAAAGFVRFVVPARPAAPADLVAPGPSYLAGGHSKPTDQIVEDMTVAFQSVWERRDPALAILTDEIARLTTGPLDVEIDGEQSEIDSVEAELQAIGDQIERLFSEQRSALKT